MFQITAVYESMLPRQPLRFLLADDPGAGHDRHVVHVTEPAGHDMHVYVVGDARPGDTPEELARRLELVQQAHQFAIDELLLPDNDSYRSYADLEPSMLRAVEELIDFVTHD